MDRDWVNRWGLDLSKEVLWVSVCQRAAKLQAVKVGGWSYRPGIKPRPHSCGARWAEAGFFSDLQLWHLVVLQPLDIQRLTVPLLKDLNLICWLIFFQESRGILKIGFALSKWPYLHRAYVVSVALKSHTTVPWVSKKWTWSDLLVDSTISNNDD